MYRLNFSKDGLHAGSGVVFMGCNYGDEAALFAHRIIGSFGFKSQLLKDNKSFLFSDCNHIDTMDREHDYQAIITFRLKKPVWGRMFFKTTYSLYELTDLVQHMARDESCEKASIYGAAGNGFVLRKSYESLEVLHEKVADKVFLKNGSCWK